ncbi:MAG: ferritin [Cytophagales bacterium CG12_big_fil_rev_8_21_14_0_65_40_12]|nr:MAG: ferritin [Cytophagales bacterium CG12_big_fil_rev_8_21_14_0_65_40_12]PIW03692.1 MAG: ferritin [Cytophagales bacterium CG17_big_fil_post_rev_8_21_14_2_50_40_13]
MKKIVALSALAFLTLFACKDDAPNPDSDIPTQIGLLPNEPLSAVEIESLMLMREEEKLAHDVYITLFNQWGINVFTNIAESEQTHTSAVQMLLDKYDLEDPVNQNEVGVFTDANLQSLYTQLVELGSKTILDAYTVSATIEDLDIADLNIWLTKVDNQDIIYVYQNLNKGSRNHMRSFYGQVINSGGSYSAQYITQTELEAIINSPRETGAW